MLIGSRLRMAVLLASTVYTALTAGVSNGAPRAAKEKQCGPTVGSKVETVSINSITSTLAKTDYKRDEFESSEAYRKRMKDVATKLPDSWLVAIPHKAGNVSYDPDAKQLTVQRAFFLDYENFGDSSELGYTSAFIGHEIEYDLSDNLDIVVSRTIKNLGTLDGQSAFGARVAVHRESGTTQAIFEREAADYEDIFEAPKKFEYKARSKPVFSLSVEPERARELKSQVRAAVLIVPKAPYFASAHVWHNKPTVSTPYQITEEFQVVIADIKCALLTDGSGLVLATRATR